MEAEVRIRPFTLPIFCPCRSRDGTEAKDRLRISTRTTILPISGVKTYLFPIVHSVPEVSFGIRELGCSAGVMITASHNPKEYNLIFGSVPDGLTIK